MTAAVDKRQFFERIVVTGGTFSFSTIFYSSPLTFYLICIAISLMQESLQILYTIKKCQKRTIKIKCECCSVIRISICEYNYGINWKLIYQYFSIADKTNSQMTMAMFEWWSYTVCTVKRAKETIALLIKVGQYWQMRRHIFPSCSFHCKEVPQPDSIYIW